MCTGWGRGGGRGEGQLVVGSIGILASWLTSWPTTTMLLFTLLAILVPGQRAQIREYSQQTISGAQIANRGKNETKGQLRRGGGGKLGNVLQLARFSVECWLPLWPM